MEFSYAIYISTLSVHTLIGPREFSIKISRNILVGETSVSLKYAVLVILCRTGMMIEMMQ